VKARHLSGLIRLVAFAFNILPPDAKLKFEDYQFLEKVGAFSERGLSLASDGDALNQRDLTAGIERLKRR
jgi:hypothetical protein